MKYLATIIILCLLLVAIDKSLAQQADTLIVRIGNKYDTANIKYSQPDIQRIILNRYNYPGYTAPGVVSFDIKRQFDFRLPEKSISRDITRLIITPTLISDSLLSAHRAFFKRHTFFVILTRGDTCYFYRAKGEYMYKNYKNDVKY